MAQLIAVNASPRTGWNTATLVWEAARGAESRGAAVEVFDLYRLEPFTGCISCFACKQPEREGRCACQDGLTPLLDAIRQADGLILGTPNYLGEATAGFRALYERLIFQSLTYRQEQMCCNPRPIPVLLIITSNAPATSYTDSQPNGQMLRRYRTMLSSYVGPTETFVCGNTLQVADYSRYRWTLFDPQAKQARHEAIFPQEKGQVFRLGAQLASLAR